MTREHSFSSALRKVAWLLIGVALAMLLSGCLRYRERFTYLNPDSGVTNHVVDVSYSSVLVWGKAARLKTETQTGEFIRTVNADEIEVKGDAESIKALGAAIGQAAGEIIKTSAGIP